MAVSIRVVIYPMKLRIRLVTIVMYIMATTTTPAITRVVTIITTTAMLRVILVTTMTPIITTNVIHVVLVFNPTTSVTCRHSITTWVAVIRIVVMHLSVWECAITMDTYEDVSLTVRILGTVKCVCVIVHVYGVSTCTV
jgi:hypothetical protein